MPRSLNGSRFAVNYAETRYRADIHLELDGCLPIGPIFVKSHPESAAIFPAANHVLGIRAGAEIVLRRALA
jgi:hypothetical protein